MSQTFSLHTLGKVAILAVLSTGLAAQSIPDRFQKNHDIHVGAGEKIGDATCVNCSVYIRGQLAGDATARFVTGTARCAQREDRPPR